jgi:hypothetical protein
MRVSGETRLLCDDCVGRFGGDRAFVFARSSATVAAHLVRVSGETRLVELSVENARSLRLMRLMLNNLDSETGTYAEDSKVSDVV